MHMIFFANLEYTFSVRRSHIISLCCREAKMFEARLVQGSTFKKIIDAIRELVIDANIDCTDAGIQMQVPKFLSP